MTIDTRSRMLNIECEYSQGEHNNSWSGIIILPKNMSIPEEKEYVYDIEGEIKDNLDNSFRYVFALNGLNKLTGELKFIIFRIGMRPIEYRVTYDPDDDCYYGSWSFVPKTYSFDKGFAKITLSPIKDKNFDKQQSLIAWNKSTIEMDNNHKKTIEGMIDKWDTSLTPDYYFSDRNPKMAKQHFKGHAKTLGTR